MYIRESISLERVARARKLIALNAVRGARAITWLEGQAIASGESDLAALWRFYNETLPQLGWRRLATGHFVRDGEGLRITVEKNDARLTVRFAIAPGTE